MAKKQPKKPSKELVTKDANEVSTEFQNMFDQELVKGENAVDAEDILISKVALVQKMSKAVDEGAVVGSFVDSVEGTELIEKGASKDYFFFGYHKLIQEFEIVTKGGKVEKEYLRTVNFDKSLPYDEEIDGVQIKRDTVIRFYALDVAEVLSGLAFPFIVEFKRTSRNAGQKLATQIAKMSTVLNVPSYAKVFSLSAKEQQKDEHKFHVKEVSVGRDITRDELQAVEKWVKQVQTREEQGTIKTDESDADNSEDTIEAEVVSSKEQPSEGSQY